MKSNILNIKNFLRLDYNNNLVLPNELHVRCHAHARTPLYTDVSNKLATTEWVAYKLANLGGGTGGGIPSTRTLTINNVSYDLSADRSWNIDSMVYPSAGIALSTGTGWGTSIVNNSANWNTAFGWGNHALAGYITSYSETDPIWTSEKVNYVTYSGATGNVNLGGNDLYANNIFATAGGGGWLAALTRDAVNGYGSLSLVRGAIGNLRSNVLSVDRIWTLPDASGTIALTSDILSYSLPTATTSNLGGVKIGAGVTIISGVISVSTNYEAPITAGTIDQYWRGDKTWQTFPSFASDANVVHLTGNETIAGRKTFTDNSYFNSNLYVKYSTQWGALPGYLTFAPQMLYSNGYNTLNFVDGTNNTRLSITYSNSVTALGLSLPSTNGTLALVSDIPTLSSLGAVPTTRTITINGVTQDLTQDRSWNISAGGGGISAETDPTVPTHVKNILAADITNWDSAYADRMKWDGGATGLVASTGRTSLGLGTAAIANSVDFAAASHTHTIADITNLQTALNGNVPYTGATGSVNLGSYNLTLTNIYASYAFSLTNELGNAYFGGMLRIYRNPTYTLDIAYTNIFAKNATSLSLYLGSGTAYKQADFNLSGLTNDTLRTYSLPDASGTIALTSNLTWATITGKPTTLSSFTNDLGNYGSFLTSYTETDTLATVTSRGSSTAENITFSNGRKGLIGVYDPTQTQAIFAMGSSYVLTNGGASNVYGPLYGLAWSYNPDHGGAGNNPQSKAGLNHQLLLMQNGVTTAAMGSGIWTSGNISAANFSGSFSGSHTGSSSGTNTGDQTNISGNAATSNAVIHSVAADSAINLVYATMADNDQFRISVGGSSNAGWVEIATADDGTEPIYVRQYTGVFSNVVRTAIILDGSGNTAFPGVVTASSFSGISYWTNVSGRPTHLSQLTNDLGNYGNWVVRSGDTMNGRLTIDTRNANDNLPLHVLSVEPYIQLQATGTSNATSFRMYPTGGYTASMGNYATGEVCIVAANTESVFIDSNSIRVNKYRFNGNGSLSGNGTPEIVDMATVGMAMQSLNYRWYNNNASAILMSLTSAGNLTANAFFESSDIRYKDVIETNPTLSLQGLDVIKFTRKGSNIVRYGYSAQQVKSLSEDLVGGTKDDLTVNYSDVHTLKIAALERRVKELEDQLKSKN